MRDTLGKITLGFLENDYSMAVHNVSGDMTVSIWYKDEEIDLVDVPFFGTYCSEADEVLVQAMTNPEEMVELVREWFKERMNRFQRWLQGFKSFRKVYNGEEILGLINHQINIIVFSDPESWMEEKGSYYYE